jgi:type I site-specific restriction endonuclease
MASAVSQTTRLARVLRAISGIQKYFASTPSLVLSAVTYTPAQLQTLLQTYATALQALQALHAQLTAAVKSDRASAVQIDALLRALESLVSNLFGETSEKLADFGFSPRKVSPMKVATKAQALAKSKATRAARHTMGSKQKAAITGDTLAPTPTTTAPSVTPSTPAKV